MDTAGVKFALKMQLRSWFEREIRFSVEPLSLEDCLDVLSEFGFQQAELEEAHWSLVLAFANRMASPYGLHAEYLKGIRTVGVQGDDRTFTPTIVLCGPFPGWDVLGELGTAIPNALPVNRVTYEFAVKKTKLEEILTLQQLLTMFGRS